MSQLSIEEFKQVLTEAAKKSAASGQSFNEILRDIAKAKENNKEAQQAKFDNYQRLMQQYNMLDLLANMRIPTK